MSLETLRERPAAPADSPDTGDDVDAAWHVLAAAELGRRLSDAEVAAARLLPASYALDLLFPDLTDAARHEALVALG
ncbi:MAG TPA: hypothetical protein VE575_10065 [Acidimicrobiales bacterium]|jgi:hypothetical protein|nr:hypothetical protein [Acidimicrobiales bacterium]